MKKGILISIIYVVVLLACKEENENASIDTKIHFKGITKIDEEGYLTAPPDTTDWRFDDRWTAKEEALFPTHNQPLNLDCSAQIILYPNPFQDLFRINLQKMPQSSRLSIRLVDKDFNVLMKKDSIVRSITLIPYVIVGKDTLGLATAGYDTLRIYYKLIDALNNEFKGHGDVLIKR